MAHRHRLEPGNWQSVFLRLEELVLANSGEDEFQEVFKLLVAKLYQESFEPDTPLRTANSASTVSRVEEILGRANRKWPQILTDGVASKLSPDHLNVCVDALDDLSLRDTSFEVMDALFEYLIGRSAKGAKGQYFTPRHVVEAIVRMVAPSQGETVCDPACGSSGFLVHAMQFAAQDLTAAERSQYREQNIWGFDIDQRAVQVARALMLIAGDGDSNLYRLNSLLTPSAGQDSLVQDRIGDSGVVTIEDLTRAAMKGWKGFDCIVTNPPFAGEVREPELLSSYELARPVGKRNERDVLFIERCVQLLRPGGRLGIVLPHNKVGASQFGFVREWFARHMRIVAVLSLGRNTFQPHTSQKAEVVFAIKREKPVGLDRIADERVLLLTSERDGKDTKGNVVQRTDAPASSDLWSRADHDLGEAVEAFTRFLREDQIEWGQR